MKRLTGMKGILFMTLGLSLLGACRKKGCTDPLATNYTSEANQDDGSCLYDEIIVLPQDELTEDIIVPTTLVAGNYKICSTIDVSAALTIMPGATFTFCAGTGLNIETSGSIIAIGTAAEPIVFKGETASAGFWSGIAVKSNNPNNQFDHVTVKDGGSYWAWEYANLYLGNSAKLSLKNSTISLSEKYGVFVEDDATFTNFSNNTLSNNFLEGLSVPALAVALLDEASNYNLSNGADNIIVRGGNVNTPQTWRATTTPLLFVGTVDVNAALTLNPGVVILMADGKGLDVNTSGSISAVGTAAQPITLKGQYASAGYAAGVKIASNNPANKFAYVNMSDLGAYWGWEYATIYVTGRLEMDNCSITNSNSWAVYIDGSATIFSSGAGQTTAAGVMATNTLTGNGAGPDADCIAGGCTVYFE